MTHDPADEHRAPDLAMALLALAPAAAVADTFWDGATLAAAALLALAFGRLACRLAGRDGSPRAAAAVLGAAGATVATGQLAHAFAFDAWVASGATLPVAVAAAFLLRPGSGLPAVALRPALVAAAALVAIGALREIAGAGTLAGARLAPAGFALATAPAAGLLALGAALAVAAAATRAR